MNYGRLASAAGTVLLIALVIPFAIYSVPGLVGADHSFVILSGSMEPDISAGDVVVIDEIDPQRIGEGDVITYERGEEDVPVTHRVIDVREGGAGPVFETKGDANDEPDRSPVPADDVIGRSVLTIPYVGHVVRFANTGVGFAVLVGAPIGLFLVTEARSLVRGLRRSPSDQRSVATAEVPPRDDDLEEHASSESTPAGEARIASAASSESHADRTGESGAETITISASDLTATSVALGLLAPYTAYVAVQLQTALSITVAFAVGFLAVGSCGLWLHSRRADAARSDGRSAVPRGDTRTELESPEPAPSDSADTDRSAETTSSASTADRIDTTDDGQADGSEAEPDEAERVATPSIEASLSSGSTTDARATTADSSGAGEREPVLRSDLTSRDEVHTSASTSREDEEVEE